MNWWVLLKYFNVENKQSQCHDWTSEESIYLLQHASLSTAVLQLVQQLVQGSPDMNLLLHPSLAAERWQHQAQAQHAASAEEQEAEKCSSYLLKSKTNWCPPSAAQSNKRLSFCPLKYWWEKLIYWILKCCFFYYFTRRSSKILLVNVLWTFLH